MGAMSDLPAPRPPHNPEAAPYWEAAVDGRLVLPVCHACGLVIWYPRAWCPACGDGSVVWTEMSGRGTVYACTVIRRGMGPWAAAAPYVGAYVELEEGPRVLTNVVTDDPSSVHIGMAVTAVFVPVVDDDAADAADPAAILRFTPSR
jgi:uncharacterized OB-fold protein